MFDFLRDRDLCRGQVEERCLEAVDPGLEGLELRVGRAHLLQGVTQARLEAVRK
jgi:hypothetical protein